MQKYHAHLTPAPLVLAILAEEEGYMILRRGREF
jgi:hypothetical protein